MWVVKKINNSCALARDSSGQDVVVFGKGIGYRKPPYELEDLSCIERTFYGVGGASLAALRDIPDDVVILASDVVEYAKARLGVNLNPNVSVTLADHINFAIQRVRDGLVVEAPFSFDVRHLYPREMQVGKRAVGMIRRRLEVDMPDEEAANIALHIIDAEQEQSDMHLTKLAAEVVSDVTAIIEEELGHPLDTDDFSYARFVMHLRYLVNRIKKGSRDGAKMAPMLEVVSASYQEAAACTKRIAAYFAERHGWEFDESETLYLLIYVQRLKNANE